MNQAYNQFRKNMQDVKDLDTKFTNFNQANPNDDLTDLLRAEIVYSISAFDKLIHELVKIGMIETFNGSRIETVQYKTFKVTIDTLLKIQNPSGIPPQFWLKQEIERQHKLLSFQEPDKVNDALNLISDKPHKWQIIATQLGMTDKDVKIYLKNIVNRRNAIVHEADEDAQTNQKTAINQSDVANDITFIENLGKAIYDLVTLATQVVPNSSKKN